MKKGILVVIVGLAVLSALISGCFLIHPTVNLEKNSYYLVTSYNDWSEEPVVLKNFKFVDNKLTIDTSDHATFLYYVLKTGDDGSISAKYGSKTGNKIFAFGGANTTFYVTPSLLKDGEIIGIGDNTKDSKNMYWHGDLNSWGSATMTSTGDGTFTYEATSVPHGTYEYKLTVATATWVDPQTFNGKTWYAAGGSSNGILSLPEDATTLTFKYYPHTNVATFTYVKSPIPLTPSYYITGSFTESRWSTETSSCIELTDPDGDGTYTAVADASDYATNSNGGFAIDSADYGLPAYKVIKVYKTTTTWYGLGNHFFSATPTTVNFYMKLEGGATPIYGTDMAAMDNLPLAVAGDFNSWSDTLMELSLIHI